MTIRVVVADDQALLLAGLAGIIDSAPDITVVGQAGDGLQAVRLARSRAPDVIVMDIRMPEMDGLEATRLIAEADHAKVLILTTFDLDEYVYAAIRGGASGFLLKDAPPADLLAAIRVIAAGDALLAPSITRRLLREFTPPPTTGPVDRVLPSITDREREVLLLVAEGLSNAEIAERLHIGPGTAKSHVASLLAKLDARDRVQLVIIAFRAGLVRT